MLSYDDITYTDEQREHALTTLSKKLAKLSERPQADCRQWLSQYPDGELQMLVLSPLGLLRIVNFKL